MPGNVKSAEVAPAIDRRGQQGTRSLSVMAPPVLAMNSSATGFGLKLGTVGGRSNWLNPRWAREAFTRKGYPLGYYDPNR
jgi:hypothetical protein